VLALARIFSLYRAGCARFNSANFFTARLILAFDTVPFPRTSRIGRYLGAGMPKYKPDSHCHQKIAAHLPIESPCCSVHAPGVNAPATADHYPITGADAAWGAASATE